jgi:hypothetical protein
MPTVPTDRRSPVPSMIPLLVSLARQLLWMSIGALVTSPVYARVMPRLKPSRRHRE